VYKRQKVAGASEGHGVEAVVVPSAAAEPQIYDIVQIGEPGDALTLEVAGAEGIVLGVSENEDTGERWFAVQVGDLPVVMLPLNSLRLTGRSVSRGSVYSGDHLRVSKTGNILQSDRDR
jgi:hypothetical protein